MLIELKTNKPKKSLGQNFLVDKNIIKKIINLTNIYNESILEIGPGTGSLTDEIIKKKPKKLTIIEKDRQLFSLLKIKYKDISNIEIINQDILNFNFEKYKKIKIFSNLPYNNSTKIILKLIKEKNEILEIIVMLQWEVAKKIYYKENIKLNKLNSLINLSAKYEIKFNLSNNVFYPKPKIRSSMVKIIPHNNKLLDIKKIELFINNIFKYKRKKLKNCVPNNYKISKLLNKRAEDLKIEELLFIYNNI